MSWRGAAVFASIGPALQAICTALGDRVAATEVALGRGGRMHPKRWLAALRDSLRFARIGLPAAT